MGEIYSQDVVRVHKVGLKIWTCVLGNIFGLFVKYGKGMNQYSLYLEKMWMIFDRKI